MATGRNEAAPSKATSYTGRGGGRNEQSPRRTQSINRVEKTQVSIGTLRHLADSPPLPLSPLPVNQRLLKRPLLPNGYILVVRSYGFSNQLSLGPLSPFRQWGGTRAEEKKKPGPQLTTIGRATQGVFPPSLAS